VVLMSAAGFFSGLTMPSRDMIVRAVTPPAPMAGCLAFVSSGFNIAGIVTRSSLAAARPRLCARDLLLMALCALLAISTVAFSTTRKRAE